VFAGTAYGGLFRSINAATSAPVWELVNQSLEPQWTWIRSIAVSPRYPFDRTIYVGTESGVYRGVEAYAGGPFSWTSLNRGFTGLDVRAVGISPDYGRDSTIFAGVYGADVYRLAATGDDKPWQPYRRVLNGLWSWAVNLTQDGVLLTGTWGRSIGRMTLTTGSDWNYQFQGVPGDAEVTAVAVSPGYCAGYTVFAGTWAHGLYRSVDGGATWNVTAYPAASGPVRGIAVSPLYERGHTLAIATWGAGVMISDNDGVSWRQQNAGLTDLKVRSVAYPPAWPNDSTMFAVTDTTGLQRYSGGRWSGSGSGLPSAQIMTVALSPNYTADGAMAVGTWGAGVYLSTDRGATWRASGGQINPYVRAITYSPGFSSDGVIYAGTNMGAYRSSNRGDAWSGLGMSSEVGMVDVTGIGVSANSPRTLFISTGGRGVWQYTETPNGRLEAQAQPAAPPQPAITTQEYVYRSFIPMAPKGRPRNPC
ncbi:MAG: hypothetical protein NTZ05_12860, partial [Chloroflexi bacterium]|nr:hypothetical protein [Chloroflexota bacterium]